MENAIAIRPALPGDASTISRLLRQLGYDRSPVALAEKISANSDSELAFVAETEGDVVGFMSLHIIGWFHRPDPAARLSALVVETKYRRLGIGRALIAFAETTVSQRGCTSIELTSNLRRRADGTYDFYDGLGYGRAEETTYFRKVLSKAIL